MMRAYDPNQPILYTHVPKCAGSSMRYVLSEWFGDGYHKVNQQQTARFGMQKLPTQDSDGNWLPNVRCIQAHFHHGHGFGLPYFYPEIDQYITILRDPFDLVVSMYFFTKGRSKQGHFWYRGRPVDISEKYPTIESYIRSYPFWMFSHLPQNLTLANYQEKLSSQFVYIGIYEDLQTSIDRLASILDQPTMTLPITNASRYDEMVPQDMREQFYFDYPLPKKIYDFALENYLSDSTKHASQLPDASDSSTIPEESILLENEEEVVCGDMLMSEES